MVNINNMRGIYSWKGDYSSKRNQVYSPIIFDYIKTFTTPLHTATFHPSHHPNILAAIPTLTSTGNLPLKASSGV